MIKRLTKHGNSWALVIERPILDLLKIDPESPVEVITDGNTLIIAPVPKETHRARVRQAAKRVMDTHEKTLRKLAE